MMIAVRNMNGVNMGGRSVAMGEIMSNKVSCIIPTQLITAMGCPTIPKYLWILLKWNFLVKVCRVKRVSHVMAKVAWMSRGRLLQVMRIDALLSHPNLEHVIATSSIKGGGDLM